MKIVLQNKISVQERQQCVTGRESSYYLNVRKLYCRGF